MPLSTSNSDLTIIIFKLAAGVMVFWVLSFGIYLILDYMYFRTDSGTTGAQINHIIKSSFDGYIMGASRAAHHYDTKAISDKLGFRFFNAGDDGKNATYQLGLLKMMIKNHVPKVIIYEIGDMSPSLDKGSIDLYPYYYKDEEIKFLLNQRDKWAKVKFLLPIFVYNRKLFPVLYWYYSSVPPPTNGYRPLQGSMHSAEQEALSKLEYRTGTSIIDPNAYYSFQQFIRTCKDLDIKLVLAYSPSYVPSDPSGYDVILSIATKHNLPVYNYGQDKRFNWDPQLFKDSTHMNESGARIFSDLIGTDILTTIHQ